MQFSGLEQGFGLYTMLTHPGSSFPTGQQLSTDTRLLPIQQGGAIVSAIIRKHFHVTMKQSLDL